MPRSKKGLSGLLPLKKRKSKEQLGKKAARQLKRKQRRKVVPHG